MANLKQGMSGSEVKDLQEKLISAGYDVGSTKADGVFGQNTLKAVQDFQRDNNLTVDGIAGKNTLGALNNLSSNKSNTGGNNGAQVAGSNAGTAGNNAAPAAAPPTTTETSTFTHPSYADVKSDTVIQAENILKEYEATRPGEWVDPYRDKYMGYLEQYENRDPFSYDFNSDALYQQYKDQYVLQGQMAMMDTMGQAAAMTGGYGNSYAQTVGQQAYNQQLGQLNEIMPELYGMAYDRYNQEGQDMLNMYNAYLGLSERDEASHQNMLDNWYQEMARLTDNANTLYQRDYNDYSTGRSEAFSNYQTGVNQAFTANENAKDREATATENQKTREFNASEAEKERIWKTDEAKKDREVTVLKATEKSSALDTEDTMKWIKNFEKAADLETLDRYTTALAGIIGPEAAAIWYDTYAVRFKDEAKDDVIEQKVTGGRGGGSGTAYYLVY